MKVRELIAALEKCRNQDAEVYINGIMRNYNFTLIEGVREFWGAYNVIATIDAAECVMEYDDIAVSVKRLG